MQTGNKTQTSAVNKMGIATGKIESYYRIVTLMRIVAFFFWGAFFYNKRPLERQLNEAALSSSSEKRAELSLQFTEIRESLQSLQCKAASFFQI